eukprot:5518684-Pleurochrysis_carterae.AAC.1
MSRARRRRSLSCNQSNPHGRYHCARVTEVATLTLIFASPTQYQLRAGDYNSQHFSPRWQI